MFRVALTIVWFFMAWLFIGLLIALVVGPILRRNALRYPRVKR